MPTRRGILPRPGNQWGSPFWSCEVGPSTQAPRDSPDGPFTGPFPPCRLMKRRDFFSRGLRNRAPTPRLSSARGFVPRCVYDADSRPNSYPVARLLECADGIPHRLEAPFFGALARSCRLGYFTSRRNFGIVGSGGRRGATAGPSCGWGNRRCSFRSMAHREGTPGTIAVFEPWGRTRLRAAEITKGGLAKAAFSR